jgi:transcriptional regulator with XRE-family HTH domain
MGKHISLANRLKELRRALTWTQQDLSRASGLTRSYISRLEMGDIALPSSDKLRALAQSLGTTPDDLLQAAGYIDNPSEASDLPEIKVYLRRKYLMQDARALQAIETILNCLHSASAAGAKTGNGGSTEKVLDRTYTGERLGNNNATAEAAGYLNDRSTGQRGRKARGDK